MGLFARLAALCVALVFVAGCGGATIGATVPLGYGSVYGYSVVGAGGVPYDIYDYPSYYWNGNYAYLVGSSWYYPMGGGWVVFQDEPWDLYQYRRSMPVQVAPPAVQYPAYPAYRTSPAYRTPAYRTYPAYRTPVQVAPPALRTPAEVAPPVQVAPPAHLDRPTQVAPPVQVAPPAPRGETYRRSEPPPPDVIHSPAPGGTRLPSAPPSRGRAVQSAPPAPRR
ncbi:hypothetical protein [Polyangium fumosum]|uniref:Uncharacterized protein n=1 Tax=Polyangium fumosum TaxID=889272 RepID=A0A4U1ISD1_9BACT|nr:hypothetical protein [Polyangium fumosum]TKC97245.1 hypothetical protein E8A74_43815 [Polyangium fumosum]